MKTWSVIGAIFAIVGAIILIFGVAKIVEIYNIYNQYGVSQFFGSSFQNTVIWTAFEPYLIGAIVFFVIGGIGFFAGSGQKTNNDAKELDNQVGFPEPNVYSQVNFSNSSISYKSTIICGSCGTLNDLDAVFCKKCGNNFGT